MSGVSDSSFDDLRRHGRAADGRDSDDLDGSGLDLEALVRDRDSIRIATKSFTLVQALKVLAVMDTLRDARAGNQRTPAARRSYAGVDAAQFEAAKNEIVWRVDTLPPEDAAAIVRLVDELLPFAPNGVAAPRPSEPR